MWHLATGSPVGANSGPSRYEYWDRICLATQVDCKTFVACETSTPVLLRWRPSSVIPARQPCSRSWKSVSSDSGVSDGFGRPRRTRNGGSDSRAGPDIPDPPGPSKSVLDYYPWSPACAIPPSATIWTKDCGSNTDPEQLGSVTGLTTSTEKNCAATVLDHYTTSFNFAQKNFSAIWLRPWWKAVVDSSITDQLGPGVTFVTGGGYTRSDSSLGNWNVGLKRRLSWNKLSLIRLTRRRPSLPPISGLLLPMEFPSATTARYRVATACRRTTASAFPSPTLMPAKRMFNIYDGPSFQDSSAYLDIRARTISDCTPSGRNPGTGVCDKSEYMSDR